MYKIEYIGSWKSIPEAAAAIYDSDIPKLEAMLQNGLNLNVSIQFSEHIKLMPLEIAVFQNNVPMIHFLLEHGADSDLAEEGPILLTAVRCCNPDVVMLFAKQVAKLSSNLRDRSTSPNSNPNISAFSDFARSQISIDLPPRSIRTGRSHLL